MLTTIAKVRELSGFDNETNITDAVVRGKISIAEGFVNGAVGKKYSLPIAYHRLNIITFTGTGSGSGTLTVTINGTGYAIAIVNTLTAERAAELFRTAAIDSDDFIVKLQGAVATIISKEDSDDIATADAQVDVTSSGATAGITQTPGAREDRYPQVVDDATAEYAAALLLLDNYGIEAEDTPKDGNAALQRVLDKLARIQGEEEPAIDIYDEVTGVQLESGTQDSPVFLPNSTTNADTDNPTAAKLGINDTW